MKVFKKEATFLHFHNVQLIILIGSFQRQREWTLPKNVLSSTCFSKLILAAHFQRTKILWYHCACSFECFKYDGSWFPFLPSVMRFSVPKFQTSGTMKSLTRNKLITSSVSPELLHHFLGLVLEETSTHFIHIFIGCELILCQYG